MFIAGLLLYGISTTYTNITNSIAKTIEEEGSFKFEHSCRSFFGGEGEGGWFNALKQAFKIGGAALSGMAIGGCVMIGTGDSGESSWCSHWWSCRYACRGSNWCIFQVI